MKLRKRKLGCGLLVVVPIAFLAVRAGAADPKATSIRQVMDKSFKGPNSPMAQIREGLQAPTPAWDQMQKQSADLVALSGVLETKTPRRGGKESWSQHVATYVQDVNALDAAVRAQGPAQANAVQQRMTASCRLCHKAHKG